MNWRNFLRAGAASAISLKFSYILVCSGKSAQNEPGVEIDSGA